MTIGRDELCSLIPHSGTMCLLDEVLEWDEDSVVCQSRSHQRADNPLRCDNGISSLQAIEYGAQAMAVHGGLLARERGGEGKPGYLAALKKIDLKVDWIDGYEEPLTVKASRLMGDDAAMVYEFTVSAGEELLASGRTTVITQPGNT